jgi:hypothetical protein
VGDSGCIQVQLIQIGYATGSVYSKVTLIDLSAIFVSVNGNRSVELPGAADLEIGHYPNSKIASSVCELIDDLGLEVFQHAIPLVQDRDLCTRGSCYVCKLHRNVATADKHDAWRHQSKFQKIFTRHHQVFALKAERSGASSGGNYDIFSAQERVVVDHDLIRRHELRGAMEPEVPVPITKTSNSLVIRPLAAQHREENSLPMQCF